MKTIFILLFSLFLAACGNDSGVNGTYYQPRQPASTVTFQDNKTLVMFASVTKKTSIFNYEKKGNVISFDTNLGTWTFKQLDDGSLMLNGVEQYIKK